MMEASAVLHHLEPEPATDPSHYETVDELCIGHSGFPSLDVSRCCNTGEGRGGGFDLGTNEGNTVSPEV